LSNGVFDTIVIGAGGMGSAAIYELARRGQRVLGLEQFTIPHELGSSAGSSRIFRFAYFEHPSYVPLMRRSYARWQQLQRDSGEPLLTVTGGLDLGPASGSVIRGSKEACRTHGLAHDVLTAGEVARRFPAWRLPAEFEGVYQADAGIVLADRAIAAHVSQARILGAEVHEEKRVLAWKSDGSRIQVDTARGSYEAGSLVIAAGAWASRLVSRLADKAIPERQIVGWFKTEGAHYAVGAFPIFILQGADNSTFYGFPEQAEEGLKVGKFRHRHEAVDPDAIDRRIAPEDEAALREIAPYLSSRIGEPLAFKTCMFVMSPDEHFIIDVLPEHPNVVVAAGFSGHGYKFCSGVGEILADLAMTGATSHDTSLFRLSRAALEGTN